MTQRNFIEAHRKELLSLAQRHGVRGLKLFGSVVRGDDTPESDIDFLVTGMEQGRDLIDFMEFKNELEKFFGRKVDVLFENGLYWYTRDKILSEAVEI